MRKPVGWGRAAVLVAVSIAGAVRGAQTLEVGPGKRFALPSEAIRAAGDGDIVEIDTRGVYEKDVTYVRANNLTVRGVGPGRALLDAQGTSAGRKGIFVTTGNDITIENIEFRNPGGEVNAAGIRAEGRNLTVRNCRFYECRDAILGGAGQVLIEFSEFSHCGHNAQPATHNLYMGGRVDRLIYRFNYSTHSYRGHLLKSRAKENWILYNRITDDEGSGSAVVDLPNGGVAVLVGNILQKGPHGGNNRLIAYGMEGVKHTVNALHVVNNTLIWENRRPAAMAFVHVMNVPEEFAPVIRNNICIGALRLTSSARFEESGNLMFKSRDKASGFADLAALDVRLTRDSPAIGQGVACGQVENVMVTSPLAEPVEDGKPVAFDLTPRFHYVHPAGPPIPRPAADPIAAGAYAAILILTDRESADDTELGIRE